jgi:hypothetical protein
MGVSPMTELANNLCDTSLGITPILDSKVSSSAFQCFRIRIQHFGVNIDPDPIRIQGFNAQKNLTNLQLEKKFIELKTTIYLSLGLYRGRPSYRRSLQLSKRECSALQNMKFLNLFLL